MNGLVASPFALLDAHSCLRLVTDAVHEDDALCLALACRALRDALGARFPTCPRAGCRPVARLAGRTTVATKHILDLRYDPEFVANGGLSALPEGIGRLAYLPAPGLKSLWLGDNVKSTTGRTRSGVSGGRLDAPGPLPTHLHAFDVECSECLPTR